MSAWEGQPQQVEPDDKIILMMQQGMLHHVLPDILVILDADIRARLLSLLYYVAEFEFAGRFSYYIPRRLLSGNSIENVQTWATSGQDLIAAHSQMLDSLLEYMTTARPLHLQPASAISATALA